RIDRRLHVEREIACDEMTVALTGLPKSYAKCLIRLSGLKGTSRAIQTAPGIFTPSGLRARVVKIVSRQQPIASVWSGALATAIVVMLCLVSVAVGGMTLVEATAFAGPVLAAATPTRSIPPDRPAQTTAAAASSPVKVQSSSRRTVTRALPPHPPTTERPVLPRTAVAPAPPVESREPNATTPLPAVTLPHAAQAATQPASAIALAATPVPLTPPSVPDETADSTRSPWSTAAARGGGSGRR